MPQGKPMGSLEINKAIAAVLVGGIAFMVAGLVSEVVVHPKRLEQSVLKIDTAAAPAAGTAVQAAALAPIAPLLAKADPAAGEAIVKKVCAVCHTFNEGGRPGVGPNLYGVVMGPHAHEQDYSYSPAMKAKTGDWDYEELNHWLKKPSAEVPGTRMAFAGINNDQQRADVIAYLRTLSHTPAPLP
jgi:cytochrome c